jgi:hypothetical protein
MIERVALTVCIAQPFSKKHVRVRAPTGWRLPTIVRICVSEHFRHFGRLMIRSRHCYALS